MSNAAARLLAVLEEERHRAAADHPWGDQPALYIDGGGVGELAPTLASYLDAYDPAFRLFHRELAALGMVPPDFFAGVGFAASEYVYWHWVTELDAKVRNLDGDQEVYFKAKGKYPNNPFGTWPWQVDWRAFVLRWDAWKAAHQAPLSRIGSDAHLEYSNLEADFNELLRRYQELEGGSTTAEKSDKTEGPGADDKAALGGAVNTLATGAVFVGLLWGVAQIVRARR